ncbi:MAG: twin-arginine translocase TatA/TatE family subunit [Alphaproteobacteria bacterium]|nr:twin-arginine translocase TatA/TatE family subunit [Alphaproteobacteria bacterium]
MGTFSIWHWLIVLVVVLVLFGGKGKISGIMGDFGKGLKSFKKNIKEEAAGSETDDAKQISEKSESAAETKDKTAG